MLAPSVDLLLLPVHAGDPERLAGEELGREVAERRDELRLDQLDLPEQVRLAGGDLLGLRVPVLRRSALENVRNHDVGALEADAAEQLVEQLARLADERDALLILVETGRLTDEHEVGVRVAGAEDNLRSSLREGTTRAAGRLVRIGPKGTCPVDGTIHGGQCKTTCGRSRRMNEHPQLRPHQSLWEGGFGGSSDVLRASR